MASAATVAMLSPAVKAGSSVIEGISSAVAAFGGQSTVACGIEIENYTKWPLTDPMISMRCGDIKKPLVQVMSGKKEFLLFRSTGPSAGISGTASWQIDDHARLVIEYSCPYNLDFPNSLTFGVENDHFDDGTPKCTKFLEYYKCDHNWNPVTYFGKTFTVIGTFEASHKPEGKISVFPNSYDHLAPNMRRLISRREYKVQAYLYVPK